MARKWVCETWKEDPSKWETEHIFNEEPEDSWCPIDPPFHGVCKLDRGPEAGISIKLLENKTQFSEGNNITIIAETGGEDGRVDFFVDDKKIGEDESKPYTQIYLAVEGNHAIQAQMVDSNGLKLISNTIDINVKPIVGDPEVALCVILMDASNSMGDQAYEGTPLSRRQLVASTAAAGIFDLERMMNNPYAFVACFKFDDRVELMFLDTIKNIIIKHDKDVKKFSRYILDELNKFKQGTDLNLALSTAHTFVDKFLKKQLHDFPIKKYKVMKQRILKHASVDAVSVPNVRVLMYTDGVQYDATGDRTLHPNPFKVNKLEGLDQDILIGAFFGDEDDDGCKQLKSLLSKCPIHDVEQFFLFDKPSKINNLRLLFRMASGASGFCPRCLEKELFR